MAYFWTIFWRDAENIQHARFRNLTLQATRGAAGGLSVGPWPATCDALHSKTETPDLQDRRGEDLLGAIQETLLAGRCVRSTTECAFNGGRVARRVVAG